MSPELSRFFVSASKFALYCWSRGTLLSVELRKRAFYQPIRRLILPVFSPVESSLLSGNKIERVFCRRRLRILGCFPIHRGEKTTPCRPPPRNFLFQSNDFTTPSGGNFCKDKEGAPPPKRGWSRQRQKGTDPYRHAVGKGNFISPIIPLDRTPRKDYNKVIKRG